MPSLPAESFRLCAARRAAQHDPYARRVTFAIGPGFWLAFGAIVWIGACLLSFLAGRGAAC